MLVNILYKHCYNFYIHYLSKMCFSSRMQWSKVSVKTFIMTNRRFLFQINLFQILLVNVLSKNPEKKKNTLQN